MPYAVHSLAARAIEIDHELSYEVQPGGPRFTVQPMSMGTGPAIFPEFDEAEAWRLARRSEVMEASHAHTA